MKNNRDFKYQDIDWGLSLIPLLGVLFSCVIFLLYPDTSKAMLDHVRDFIGDKLGSYYIIMGLGVFACSIFLAFSDYGRIKLGNVDKPDYSSRQWGMMVFTSTMAADIVFYAFCEWALYFQSEHIQSFARKELWASTYPLFHWGPIAWGLYLVLAVAFGFMLYVKGVSVQKFSAACRPLLGNKVDGVIGKIIDLIAVFALLAGTATTFSLATPLITSSISRVFSIVPGVKMSILVLVFIAFVYTVTVWFGMKGISRLAYFCTNLFFFLLAYVFLCGGETVYIVETGISSIGNLIQNFSFMATWMDPLRKDSFPQDWTIYYWAYWMAWCVATPFFIGSISRGKRVKEIIMEGYLWGLSATFTCFIILGNYGMAQQLKHDLNMSGSIDAGLNVSDAIINLIETLPMPEIFLVLLVITMVAFYSTTFDALTIVMSLYSYKKISVGIEPDRSIRVFWSIMFILLPIGLLFARNSIYQLQSIALIAAFPIGVVVVMVIVSFFIEAKKVLVVNKIKNKE